MMDSITSNDPPGNETIKIFWSKLSELDQYGLELIYVLTKYHYVHTEHTFKICESDDNQIVLPFGTFAPKLQNIIISFVSMHHERLKK